MPISIHPDSFSFDSLVLFNVDLIYLDKAMTDFQAVK